jgi:hypothetical protein
MGSGYYGGVGMGGGSLMMIVGVIVIGILFYMALNKQNTGMAPSLFRGGIIKSINQWYNKMRSTYYAILHNGKKNQEGTFESKKLIDLDKQGSRKVKDFFHKVSFHIVKLAKENKI